MTPACAGARRPHAGRAALGPYVIRAELGHGGMGVVYTAHDPRLDRRVAIKLLTPDLTRDETAKQLFLQEARATSALDHPDIRNLPHPEELEQEPVRRSKNDETDSATGRSSDSA